MMCTKVYSYFCRVLLCILSMEIGIIKQQHGRRDGAPTLGENNVAFCRGGVPPPTNI